MARRGLSISSMMMAIVAMMATIFIAGTIAIAVAPLGISVPQHFVVADTEIMFMVTVDPDYFTDANTTLSLDFQLGTEGGLKFDTTKKVEITAATAGASDIVLTTTPGTSSITTNVKWSKPPSKSTARFLIIRGTVIPNSLTQIQILPTSKIQSLDKTLQQVAEAQTLTPATTALAGGLIDQMTIVDVLIGTKSVQFTLTDVLLDPDLNYGDNGKFTVGLISNVGDSKLSFWQLNSANPIKCTVNDVPITASIPQYVSLLELPIAPFLNLGAEKKAVVKCDPKTVVTINLNGHSPQRTAFKLAFSAEDGANTTTYLSRGTIQPNQPTKPTISPYLPSDETVTLSFWVDPAYFVWSDDIDLNLFLSGISLATSSQITFKTTTSSKDYGVRTYTTQAFPASNTHIKTTLKFGPVPFDDETASRKVEIIAHATNIDKIGVTSGSLTANVDDDGIYTQPIAPITTQPLKSMGTLTPAFTVVPNPTNLRKSIDFTIAGFSPDSTLDFDGQTFDFDVAGSGDAEPQFRLLTDPPHCTINGSAAAPIDLTHQYQSVLKFSAEKFKKGGDFHVVCDTADMVIEYGRIRDKTTPTTFSALMQPKNDPTLGYVVRYVESASPTPDPTPDPTPTPTPTPTPGPKPKKPTSPAVYVVIAIVLLGVIGGAAFYAKKQKMFCFKDDAGQDHVHMGDYQSFPDNGNNGYLPPNKDNNQQLQYV